MVEFSVSMSHQFCDIPKLNIWCKIVHNIQYWNKGSTMTNAIYYKNAEWQSLGCLGFSSFVYINHEKHLVVFHRRSRCWELLSYHCCNTLGLCHLPPPMCESLLVWIYMYQYLSNIYTDRIPHDKLYYIEFLSY